MEIPVLVRPTATGFRASTGSPFDVTEDGPSRDEAVAAVRARIAAELSAGATVANVRVSDDEFLRAWEGLTRDPTFADFQAAVEAYRDQVDAEDAARLGDGSAQ